MKYFIKVTLIPALIFLILLVSCNEEDDVIPPQYPKVAVLAQGLTFDDLGFLQSCKTGIELAELDFDLEVFYDLDTATDNFQERINTYCDLNFDLIIAIGYMWNDAVVEAAKKYPWSKFVYVDAVLSEPQENALSIVFDVDEVAFPLGFLSAWWADVHDSNDPILGYVGAMNIPQIRQFTEPYDNGASWYNQQYLKNVEVIGDYAGNFFNQEFGKGIADSLINLGADVIYGGGSETGNGALLKAKEKGVVAIGIDVDQYYSFPEVSDILLSCAMKRLDNALYDVIKSYVENTFNGGGIFTGKLSNEGVAMAPFHDYENQIPDSIKQKLETIKQGIIDGSVDTGW